MQPISKTVGDLQTQKFWNLFILFWNLFMFGRQFQLSLSGIQKSKLTQIWIRIQDAKWIPTDPHWSGSEILYTSVRIWNIANWTIRQTLRLTVLGTYLHTPDETNSSQTTKFCKHTKLHLGRQVEFLLAILILTRFSSLDWLNVYRTGILLVYPISNAE